MSTLILKGNKSYAWSKYQDTHIIGTIFDDSGKQLSSQEVTHLFEQTNSETEFKDLLSKLNGFFSVVTKDNDGQTLLAVDHTNSFPLFYSTKNHTISDKPLEIVHCNDLSEKDTRAIDELFATGYVTSQNTIIKGIYSLPVGHYAVVSKHTITPKPYFLFLKTKQETVRKIPNELLTVARQATERLITYAQGKTLVLPLSGGRDSRLLALLLKDAGYTNVVCYSYGKKTDWEVVVSKNVAKHLGFKWVLAEYRKDNLRETHQGKALQALLSSHFDLQARLNLQDFSAVIELKKTLPKNAIFIPGHAGDFLAGKKYLQYTEKNMSISAIAKKLAKKHHSIFRGDASTQSFFITKIEKDLHQFNLDLDVFTPKEIMEFWEWKERQAKYITQSVRVYEHFGFSWWLPLWDKELTQFFLDRPLSQRDGKLYDEMIEYLDPTLEELCDTLIKKHKPQHFFTDLIIKRVFNVKLYRYPKEAFWFSLKKSKDIKSLLSVTKLSFYDYHLLLKKLFLHEK